MSSKIGERMMIIASAEKMSNARFANGVLTGVGCGFIINQ